MKKDIVKIVIAIVVLLVGGLFVAVEIVNQDTATKIEEELETFEETVVPLIEEEEEESEK